MADEVLTERRGQVQLEQQALPQMPDDLKQLFEETH